MENSIWKPLEGWDRFYEYNQWGSVRRVDTPNVFILKTRKIGNYLSSTTFCNNGKRSALLVHRLVWQYSNGPIPEDFDVHHLDENTLNNNINNLLALDKRRHRSLHKTAKIRSRFTGVRWIIKHKTWCATIISQKKRYHLGWFKDELSASNAYECAFSELKAGKDLGQLYPGAGWRKKGTIYQVNGRFAVKYKKKHIGCFASMEAAENALKFLI